MEEKTKLTSKQAKILSFIEQEISQHGRAPTLRAIAKHFGYAAIGTVQDHLRALRNKGFLEQEPRVACGIKPAFHSESLSVPILGFVPAGRPIEAIEDCAGYVAVPSRWRGELYALKVKGQSMIEAGIMDGDLVIVKKQNTAEDGEIVVALIDGEATVKYFEKRHGRVRLLPANPRFSPIELDPERENAIAGKVVSVQRYY